MDVSTGQSQVTMISLLQIHKHLTEVYGFGGSSYKISHAYEELKQANENWTFLVNRISEGLREERKPVLPEFKLEI